MTEIEKTETVGFGPQGSTSKVQKSLVHFVALLNAIERNSLGKTRVNQILKALMKGQ